MVCERCADTTASKTQEQAARVHPFAPLLVQYSGRQDSMPSACAGDPDRTHERGLPALVEHHGKVREGSAKETIGGYASRLGGGVLASRFQAGSRSRSCRAWCESGGDPKSGGMENSCFLDIYGHEPIRMWSCSRGPRRRVRKRRRATVAQVPRAIKSCPSLPPRCFNGFLVACE